MRPKSARNASSTPVNKFCNGCSSAPKREGRLGPDNRISTAEDNMEAVLGDPEVKVLLTEKMRELKFGEKLSWTLP